MRLRMNPSAVFIQKLSKYLIQTNSERIKVNPNVLLVASELFYVFLFFISIAFGNRGISHVYGFFTSTFIDYLPPVYLLNVQSADPIQLNLEK